MFWVRHKFLVGARLRSRRTCCPLRRPAFRFWHYTTLFCMHPCGDSFWCLTVAVLDLLPGRPGREILRDRRRTRPSTDNILRGWSKPRRRLSVGGWIEPRYFFCSFVNKPLSSSVVYPFMNEQYAQWFYPLVNERKKCLWVTEHSTRASEVGCATQTEGTARREGPCKASVDCCSSMGYPF